MKWSLRRFSSFILAGVLSLGISGLAKAQVLDAPQIFQLPPFDPDALNTSGDGLPYTLDTGSLAGLTSSIGNATLNDVAIMSIPNQEFPPTQGDSTLNGRVWSLVHTSTTDTQALAVATPVDIFMDFSNLGECYDFVTSVQILDLSADGANDLAFMGPCFGQDTGFADEQNVLGLLGNSSDPFQQSDSLTQLGTQLGGSLFDLDGGQLAMVAADFDGDGNIDLGNYNLDQDANAQFLQVLLNDGSFGLLPSQTSPIDSPFEPPQFDNSTGFEITSGDFDGNGTADIAVIYGVGEVPTNVSELLVYSGNGDGTFQQIPMAQGDLADQSADFFPASITSGNFDSNDFSDFAVTWFDNELDVGFLSVVLCSSSGCNATALPFSLNNEGGVLVAADFDNDGFDDIANIFNNGGISAGFPAVQSAVQIHLNGGNGQFDINPDQTLSLATTSTLDEAFTTQVVTDDIDGCGGPDLAFTGGIFNLQGTTAPETGIGQGATPLFEFQAAVAFNPNEDPTADAGPEDGVRVSSGVQIGGNPTCSDPTNDAMSISWVQTGGSPATLNDSSAANPIITSSTGGDITFTVTCTDPCGLSASDSVTVSANNLIQGSGPCSLSTTVASGASFGWILLPLSLGGLTMMRRRKS